MAEKHQSEDNSLIMITFLIISLFLMVFIDGLINPLKNSELSNVSVRDYQNLPRLSGRAGYVYVIRDWRTGNYKIGYTKNPGRRLRELQRASRGRLRYVRLMEARDAFAVEQHLHRRYSRARIRPDWEWFKLSNAQVQAIGRAGSAAVDARIENVSSDKAKHSEKKAGKWKSCCLYVFIGFIILSVLSAAFSPNSTSRRTPSSRTAYTVRTQNPRTYYVTSPNPHVRACPSTACSSIGGLARGDRIQALGRIVGEKPEGYSSHTWIKFKHGGAVAYVHGSLVSTKRPNS